MSAEIVKQKHDGSDIPGRIKHRRQFFFGPEGHNEFADWNKIAINDRDYLAVHPDLELSQSGNQDRSIILIGYLLDPDNPRASNAEIVEGMVRGCDTFEKIIEKTNDYGGRWILIANIGPDSIMFNDAAGLRQIYYASSVQAGKTWCASEPGQIAEKLKLSMDDEAFEFMKFREFEDNYDSFKVYWWPGNTSLYKEIKHLLPNHYLDIRTGLPHRFWPKADLENVSMRDALSISSELFRGLVDCAYRRYELALSLTSGWDSRLMLAASKEIVHDLYCYTLEYPGLKENKMDVVIPSKLLKKFSLTHHLISYPELIDEEFKCIFRINNPSVNKAYCADVQALYDNIPKNRVCITGDVAEIVKCQYRISGRNSNNISAHDLAKFAKMGTHPFAIKAFEEWLSMLDAKSIHVLDMFSWEQFVGRLQAQNQSECDIVFDTFAPYNCRKLLSTILSLEEKYRKPPLHMFHRKVIKNLWKDTLSEPINPPENMNIKYVLQNILTKFHLYQIIPESAMLIAKRVIKRIS